MTDKLRILVVSRSYPSADNLYQYPFVHRRVAAYQAAGHEVTVFRPAATGQGGAYRFDGVDCMAGDSVMLDRLANQFRPDVLAVHGLGPTVWPEVERLAVSVPMAAWLHGSEIPGFLRRKSELDCQPADFAQERYDECRAFWDQFLHSRPETPLVFPSKSAIGYMNEGLARPVKRPAVIANPIDTQLFAHRPKRAEDRFNVLVLRPFDSRAYGNDLAIAAIGRLHSLPAFQTARFTIIGDGSLFDETIAPIRGASNVSIRQTFLTQRQIAAEHAGNGIFLVPTRLDTQGVSRDEAMASGLVPVTNAIDPINEFVDPGCAVLAAPDDAEALADAVARLAGDPEAFLKKSAGAAERIGATRSSAAIAPQDVALLRQVLADWNP